MLVFLHRTTTRGRSPGLAVPIQVPSTRAIMVISTTILLILLLLYLWNTLKIPWCLFLLPNLIFSRQKQGKDILAGPVQKHYTTRVCLLHLPKLAETAQHLLLPVAL